MSNNHRNYSIDDNNQPAVLEAGNLPQYRPARRHASGGAMTLDSRVIAISGAAIGVGLVAALIARALTLLIGLVTNLAYYGRVSTNFVSPAGNHLGLAAIIVPVVGGILVGLMARYGSKAIRGHGIPEAMEQVLTNESRIPPRIMFLKPVSSAIAIGTGGPFGAEGPIIATGGALGSFLGQLLKTTADERKTLLAAGAAAGMAATFGSPIAAVILAVELLLFEFRPRSIIPVALAAAAATGVRFTLVGAAAVFPMVAPGASPILPATGPALFFYALLGSLIGFVAIGITKLVYAIEDSFEHLPIHWMWWPAIGGLAVGIVGLIAPRTLGVGYVNIEQIVDGSLVGKAVLFLCVMKLISWSISLGSGTSGGTLAPLFTIGGGLGAFLGGLAVTFLPQLGVDSRLAALVGMAAVFSGSSRAMLASVLFAYETTQQPLGLLPLLTGCTAAYLVSCLFLKNTIMTEKIVRRGVRVPAEYEADYLHRMLVRDVAVNEVVCLSPDQTVAEIRQWFAAGSLEARHQGYPVTESSGRLLGLVMRDTICAATTDSETRLRELLGTKTATVYDDSTLREAADHMALEEVTLLPVVTHAQPDILAGIVSRSELIVAHTRRLSEQHDFHQTIRPGSRPNGV